MLRSKYMPQAVILHNQPGKPGEQLAAVVPTAAVKMSPDGTPAVYICENYACREPVGDTKKLVEQI